MKTQQTKDMERFLQAFKLCCMLHENQVDKCGQPYWIHPFTVAMRSFIGYNSNISYCIVGLLHDVLEDSGMHIEALKILIELTSEEAEALQLLTHKQGVSYDEYIDSIVESGNEVAMVVKADDLLHNANLNRMTDAGIEVTDDDEKRVKKYRIAFKKLLAKIQEEK